ncbi:alpha/beta fold hydrolase [Nioella ostreopsis]|uniref:alpha/beta fold hydrolase n=1 Tax=Nioella ostreopsis TaxID=2448479 RepID=UPI000FD78EA5|nr:alpha/beta hydrolase [Nioella ostreopsis]
MLHFITKGSRRNLLVLHGATLDHRHMVETVEPLFETRAGWRRIYLDLPGHGQSPAGDVVTQEDLLNRVLAFMDATFAGEPFAIVGESRGSYIAQGLAYLRPDLVEGLCLIVPGGAPSSDTDRIPAHRVMVADPALRASLSAAERPRFDRLVVQTAETWDKTLRCKLPTAGTADADLLKSTGESFLFPFDVTGPDGRFDKPSLIVAGRQDSMSGYLDAMDLMPVYPRATLAVLDTAGHAVAWERPEAFTALACDWLDRLEAE